MSSISGSWLSAAHAALSVLSVAVLMGTCACSPPCSTDADCGDRQVCVNGECRASSGGPDATPAGDASARADRAGSGDGAALDRALADSSAEGDRVTFDGSASLDRTAPERPAADRAPADRGVADAGPAPDRFGVDAARLIDAAAAADTAGLDVVGIDSAPATDGGALTGLVGAPCQDDGDCTAPAGAHCITSFPNGYCSASCGFGEAGGCGAGAACYCEEMQGSDCAAARCFKTCWRYDTCRQDEGYVCEEADWLGFTGDEDLCYPQ